MVKGRIMRNSRTLSYPDPNLTINPDTNNPNVAQEGELDTKAYPKREKKRGKD